MQYNIDYIKKETQSEAKSLLSEQKYLNRTLAIDKYEDSIVLPFKDRDTCLGGVVDSKGIFVQKSGLYEERTCGYYKIEESEIQYEDSTVFYLGYLLPVYGHLLTDDIKKVWALDRCAYDKIVYVSTWGLDSPPKHVVEMFELMGIDINKCHCITKATRFKAIIVPDNSFIHHDGKKYYTEEYKFTIQAIAQNVPVDHSSLDKIYFSRSKIHQGWQRDQGEESIERVFRKMGFSIIYPETLSIREQIGLVKACNYFAATEGSIAHNSIWCNSEAKVLLLRKCDYINPWQMAINEVASADVTYIDVHKSINNNKQFPMVGPYYLCVTSELCHYFNTFIFRVPLCFRPSWYVYKYKLEEKKLYQKVRRLKKRLLGD